MKNSLLKNLELNHILNRELEELILSVIVFYNCWALHSYTQNSTKKIVDILKLTKKSSKGEEMWNVFLQSDLSTTTVNYTHREHLSMKNYEKLTKKTKVQFRIKKRGRTTVYRSILYFAQDVIHSLPHRDKCPTLCVPSDLCPISNY